MHVLWEEAKEKIITRNEFTNCEFQAEITL